MFGRKKNNIEEVNNRDIMYLLFKIADNLGIELDTAQKDEEENAIVDTDKFFKEELEEGDHDDSIIENDEGVDKRKIIDEIGGILKGKVSEEIWRTIIGLVEKDAYNPSTRSEKDNKCNNVVEEQREDGEKCLEEKTEQKPILNTLKNSIRNNIKTPVIYTKAQRYAETNKKYSL